MILQTKSEGRVTGFRPKCNLVYSIEGVEMKKIFVISLIALLSLSCALFGAPSKKDSRPTKRAEPTSTRRAEPTSTRRVEPTPTPPWSSCGVALADHNAKIWIVGNLAAEACEMIITYEKMHSYGLPIWWSAEYYVDSFQYHVVCSDQFSNLIYEVVDTGGAMYGGHWCDWMTSRFGVAPYPVEPDIFNLIGP